jgi:hypothetical protein
MLLAALPKVLPRERWPVFLVSPSTLGYRIDNCTRHGPNIYATATPLGRTAAWTCTHPICPIG